MVNISEPPPDARCPESIIGATSPSSSNPYGAGSAA
jgi:hypothetical protein